MDRRGGSGGMAASTWSRRESRKCGEHEVVVEESSDLSEGRGEAEEEETVHGLAIAEARFEAGVGFDFDFGVGFNFLGLALILVLVSTFLLLVSRSGVGFGLPLCLFPPLHFFSFVLYFFFFSASPFLRVPSVCNFFFPFIFQ